MKGADFMGNNSENKPDRYINIGIVAHVDAGKTTLSESMLYHAGAIRKLGRVDHKDAFLDTDQMERERGITIFSKQAVFRWKDRTITLLDTPGHVDFSAEMERVLQVLDCACCQWSRWCARTYTDTMEVIKKISHSDLSFCE